MSLQLIMLLICKTLAAPTGEMLRPLAAPQSFFETERGKLRGMNETTEKINVKKEYQGYQQEMKQRVYEIANVAQVPFTEAGSYVHMNILQLKRLCRYGTIYRKYIFPILISGETVQLRFAARTIATKSLVLLTITYECDSPEFANLTVNCEKMVIGNLLMKDIKAILSQ